MTFPVFAQKDYQYHIEGPAGRIQLCSRGGAGEEVAGIAVICHPHPLHGGTMDNKVVTTLARAYRDAGIPQVRFNFRGVGDSEGEFGELEGEKDDLRAVLMHLLGSRPDTPLYLAGFSFGSAVAAAVYGEFQTRHLTLVAPPVGRYLPDYPQQFDSPLLLIQGACDEIIDPQAVRVWQAGISSPVNYQEMPEAGHFFHGGITALYQICLDEFRCLSGQSGR